MKMDIEMDSSPNKNKGVIINELNENDILELNEDESETKDDHSLVDHKIQIQDSGTSKNHRRDSIEDFNQHSDRNMSNSETTKSVNILRLQALIDSDSDEATTAKIDLESDRDILLTDSESDNKINNISKFENHDKITKKFTKKRKKAKVLVDSSDDDEEKPKEFEFDENDKKKSIYDSDTSSDDTSPQEIIPKNLPKRESAKEAMVQMQIIQSESQRMAREANIRVPYHRPKQYSLKQFLSRRTDATLSPSIGFVPQTTAANIKMNKTELIEYAKKIEVRESEAKLFFKNDDGDEEEEEEANTHNDDEIHQKNKTLKENKVITDEVGKANAMEIENENDTMAKDKDYLDELVASGRTDDLIYKEIPRLTGETIIDLDSDRSTPVMVVCGAQELFERFIKQTKIHKPRTTAQLDLLKTVNGIIEHETITISVNNEETFDRDPIPGAAFLKLKSDLRNKIVQKRHEDFLRKNNTIEDAILDEANEFSDCQLNYEDEQNLEDEHNTSSAEENDGEKDENEETHMNDDKNSSQCENEDADDDADELEAEIVVKKSRILVQLDDSDDDELVKTNMDNSLSNIFETQNGIKTIAESTDELMGLCSGNFDSTQINSDKCKLAETIQTQSNELELIDLCSGVFNTQVLEKSEEFSDTKNESPKKISILEKIRNTFDSSDSENDDISKPRLNKHKQIKKFVFSDDEDEDEEEDENGNGTEEQYVNYDSEENEIILQETKERQKEVKTFFDKEAELSESEWGSADEDERDMDKLDIELGDEDEFDQEKLHNQLERIHMRQVLDQDVREVKIIQEMFVEDEERDGVGRERKFRWTNANNSTILGDEDKLNPNGEDHSGDENEELWRKMRFERESILKEETDKNINLETTHENIGSNIFFSEKKNKIKIFNKQNYIPKSSVPNSPFLTSNNVSSRASFLSRDETTLSRLSSLIKNSNDSDGIQLESGKTKSFVFTVNEEKIQFKRKSTDIVLNTETKKFKNNEYSKSSISKGLFRSLK